MTDVQYQPPSEVFVLEALPMTNYAPEAYAQFVTVAWFGKYGLHRAPALVAVDKDSPIQPSEELGVIMHQVEWELLHVDKGTLLSTHKYGITSCPSDANYNEFLRYAKTS